MELWLVLCRHETRGHCWLRLSLPCLFKKRSTKTQWKKLLFIIIKTTKTQSKKTRIERAAKCTSKKSQHQHKHFKIKKKCHLPTQGMLIFQFDLFLNKKTWRDQCLNKRIIELWDIFQIPSTTGQLLIWLPKRSLWELNCKRNALWQSTSRMRWIMCLLNLTITTTLRIKNWKKWI